MATGLYVLQDGSIMVAYGPRKIPISSAQYRANGYKPALDRLAAKTRFADKTSGQPAATRQSHPLARS